MDVGREACFFLLHGHPDRSVEVIWPPSRSPEVYEGPNFRVPILIIGQACRSKADGMDL